MARKTGVPALMIVAREMCRLIVKFTPVIEALYPTNTVLIAALATANAACHALHSQLMVVREMGD